MNIQDTFKYSYILHNVYSRSLGCFVSIAYDLDMQLCILDSKGIESEYLLKHCHWKEKVKFHTMLDNDIQELNEQNKVDMYHDF